MRFYCSWARTHTHSTLNSKKKHLQNYRRKNRAPFHFEFFLMLFLLIPNKRNKDSKPPSIDESKINCKYFIIYCKRKNNCCRWYFVLFSVFELRALRSLGSSYSVLGVSFTWYDMVLYCRPTVPHWIDMIRHMRYVLCFIGNIHIYYIYCTLPLSTFLLQNPSICVFLAACLFVCVCSGLS